MTAVIHGHLDICNEKGIAGWAWDPQHPNDQVGVVCEIDGRTVANLEAGELRSDLLASGIGTGEHGFQLEIPAVFFDGRQHTARLFGCHGKAKVELAGSPQKFRLSAQDLVSGDFEIGNDGFLQGWVIDRGAPSRTVSVDVIAAGVGKLTVPAGMYRRDLLALGDGSGMHGFQVVLPRAWYDHETLSIRVCASKNGRVLGNGPVEFDTRNSYFSQNCKEDAMSRPPRAARHAPLISILLPVYNPPLEFLDAAIGSVKAQSYFRWQLCIADDASTNPGVRELLEKHAAQDDRIELVFRENNGHICRSSNSALALAKGEFFALLDHDDLLHADALLEVAHVVGRHPDVGIIFSDEDKCDEHGMRYGPYRKTGWDPDLILGQNCVSHLGVFRTDLVRKLGGFRPGYEGSQDYDLALRASRALTSAQIRHIPRVLYHWRAIPGSTALSNTEKSYAVIAMQKALRSHLRASGSHATCEPAVQGVYCRVMWPVPVTPPSISIILPCAGTDPGAANLISALTALQWPGMQILTGNAQANEIDSLRMKYLEAMLAAAKGELCIWIEHATPVGDLRGWLNEIVSQALRSEIAVVGVKLLDRTMKVLMAGFTYVDPAEPQQYGVPYRGLAADDPGHGGGAGLCRTVQAISPHVFASRRKTLLMLLADSTANERAPTMTELSLRARRRKLRTVLTPFVMAIESAVPQAAG